MPSSIYPSAPNEIKSKPADTWLPTTLYYLYEMIVQRSHKCLPDVKQLSAVKRRVKPENRPAFKIRLFIIIKVRLLLTVTQS